MENISRKTSKDVVRKFLYNNIKQAFTEADVQFEELDKSLCVDTIDVDRANSAFEELSDDLLCIASNMTAYTKEQMEVIGVDKDCSIDFIKSKIESYQFKIEDLKGGIQESRVKAIRFTPDIARRNLEIPYYDKFISSAKSIEEYLITLQEIYQKLEETLYSEDSEQELNRFKKHYKNVKNQVTEEAHSILRELEAVRKKPAEYIDYSSSNYILTNDFSSHVLESTVGKEYYSAYNNPQKLIKIIKEKGLDNEQVNAFFRIVALNRVWSEKMDPSTPLRGRPPKDFCFIDDSEFLMELLNTSPVKLTSNIKGTSCNKFFEWLVAFFVTLSEYVCTDLYGFISAFYRYIEEIGIKIPYSLRYFQKKINEFRQFIKDKSKGGFYNLLDECPTKSWARRLKRFAPLEKLRDIISQKFIQFQTA